MHEEDILVVDDEASIRETVAAIVRSMGFGCQTAADGREALDLIRGNGFDIVLTDVRMAGIDGLELMERARKVRPCLSFVVMTGYGKQYHYSKVVGGGATDFIKKPFTRNELELKLHRILVERTTEKDRRHLEKERASLNEKLKTLLLVARDLTAELNTDRLIELIIRRVTEILEAERTSLYLIDWDNRQIWTRVAEQVGQIRMPLGLGIAGRVAQTGEAVNVGDAWGLEYFNRDFDARNNFRTRSVLCVPIHNRQHERIGVLQVLNKKNHPLFTNNDVIILEAICSQVAVGLENSFLLDELQISFESSVRTLSATVDAKHLLTAGHSRRVTEYSLLIAREMGVGPQDLEVIKYAALLHDIGKIGIRDEVLMKQGTFTPEERAEMNTHTRRTRDILENFHFPKALRRVPLIASQHHEKINGEGYPDGLAGDVLPLGSRILAVSDVFDALTSRRDYPKYVGEEKLEADPMPLEKVMGILREDAGTHFDPEVVAAFFRCLPKALRMYHGTHFAPEYVDPTLRTLETGRSGLDGTRALLTGICTESPSDHPSWSRSTALSA